MKLHELKDDGPSKGCDPCEAAKQKLRAQKDAALSKAEGVRVTVVEGSADLDDLVRRSKRRHPVGPGTYFGLNWQDDPDALRELLAGEERLTAITTHQGVRAGDIKLEHELKGSLAMREVRERLPKHIVMVDIDGRATYMRMWPNGEVTPLDKEFSNRPDAHLGAVED